MLKWILGIVLVLVVAVMGTCWYGYSKITSGGGVATVTVAAAAAVAAAVAVIAAAVPAVKAAAKAAARKPPKTRTSPSFPYGRNATAAPSQERPFASVTGPVAADNRRRVE